MATIKFSNEIKKLKDWIKKSSSVDNTSSIERITTDDVDNNSGASHEYKSPNADIVNTKIGQFKDGHNFEIEKKDGTIIKKSIEDIGSGGGTPSKSLLYNDYEKIGEITSIEEGENTLKINDFDTKPNDYLIGNSELVRGTIIKVSLQAENTNPIKATTFDNLLDSSAKGFFSLNWYKQHKELTALYLLEGISIWRRKEK